MPPTLIDVDSISLSQRTRNGRQKMWLVLAICAAPVIASYFTYFVVKPQARTNYSALIEPTRQIPPDLPLHNLQGQAVAAGSLKGQWLLLVTSTSACDAGCEKRLWLQRQLRETLNADAERVDKVWLIVDDAMPSPELLRGVTENTNATVLRTDAGALINWLQPAPDDTMTDHIYIVDPLGQLMMRAPVDADASRLKADVVKLLRASANWDRPGR